MSTIPPPRQMGWDCKDRDFFWICIPWAEVLPGHGSEHQNGPICARTGPKRPSEHQNSPIRARTGQNQPSAHQTGPIRARAKKNRHGLYGKMRTPKPGLAAGMSEPGAGTARREATAGCGFTPMRSRTAESMDSSGSPRA